MCGPRNLGSWVTLFFEVSTIYTFWLGFKKKVDPPVHRDPQGVKWLSQLGYYDH